MSDFLRSVLGTAGPRLARAVIKRLRIACFTSTVIWIALWFAVYAFMPAEMRSLYIRWALIPGALVLGWNIVCGDLETQIRHLNDLALAPWEAQRMTPSRARLLWFGDALIVMPTFLMALVLAAQPDEITGWALGLFVLSLAVGFLVNLWANSFAGLFAPRYSSYDPEEDEWSGFWWWR